MVQGYKFVYQRKHCEFESIPPVAEAAGLHLSIAQGR